MKFGVLACLVIACGSPSRDVPTDAPASDAVDLDAPGDAPGDADAPPDGPPPVIGDPVAALAEVEPKCSGNGWCWFDPLPAGIGYSKIFSSGPDNIWMIGGFPGSSIVLQWNGTSWVVHRPVHDPVLTFAEDSIPLSVNGRGPNDMWLLYGGTVQHWDGTAWEIKDTFNQSQSMTYNNVWVDEDSVPWITTAQGTVRRYINGAWSEISVGCTCSLGAIFGTSNHDVFFSTLGGVIHFDGQSFQFVFNKTLSSFQGVERDVWASGSGLVAHWDGKAFAEVADPVSSTSSVISAAGFLAPDDVWWMGGGGFLHWDGEQITLTPLDVDASYGDACCPPLNAATIVDGRWWVVGGHGGIWTKVSPTTLAPVLPLRFLGGSIWGTSIDDLYFGGIHEIRHWDGSAWETIPFGAGDLQGIPGGGIGGTLELFATANRRDATANQNIHVMLHFNGVSWTETEFARSPGTSSDNAMSLRALGPDEALLVGKGQGLYYHDGIFEPVSTGTSLGVGSMAGTSDHLYLLGENAQVFEWDRETPLALTRDTSFPALTVDAGTDLLGIAFVDGHVWVTQQNGFVAYHKVNDGPWETVDFFAQAHVVGHKIVAISPTNVLLFGNDSTSAARWNGTQFVYETVPMSGRISSAFVLPDGTTLALGADGVLVHQ